jgi:hypothetical protein
MRWIDLQRGNSPMKLLEIKDSPKKDKKLRAVFQYNTGKIKNVEFGAKGYRDYILISNPDSSFYIEDKEERDKVREAYRERHDNEAEAKALKRADTPASLSMYILWGDSGSITQNIKAYRKRFNV